MDMEFWYHWPKAEDYIYSTVCCIVRWRWEGIPIIECYRDGIADKIDNLLQLCCAQNNSLYSKFIQLE